jgi:Trk-type K+ transport system membrane component
MVDNLGLALTPDSMITFRNATWPMLVMFFLTSTGHTFYPCLLRLLLWTFWKVSPKGSTLKSPSAFCSATHDDVIPCSSLALPPGHLQRFLLHSTLSALSLLLCLIWIILKSTPLLLARAFSQRSFKPLHHIIQEQLPLPSLA